MGFWNPGTLHLDVMTLAYLDGATSTPVGSSFGTSVAFKFDLVFAMAAVTLLSKSSTTPLTCSEHRSWHILRRQYQQGGHGSTTLRSGAFWCLWPMSDCEIRPATTASGTMSG